MSQVLILNRRQRLFITQEVPIEFFDFIIIDECHRSIYNLWKQVFDYFDAFFNWSYSNHPTKEPLVFLMKML